MTTFAEAVAEIQKLIDEGRSYEQIYAAVAKHVDDGTIIIGDVETVIDGVVVTSFEVDLT